MARRRRHAPAPYAPTYWPTWLGLGLLRLLNLLPWSWQLALGRFLGDATRRLARSRARVARTNLRLCFPELETAARERLLRDHFRALGMGVVELAMSWWGGNERLRSLGSVEGLEHFDAALAEGHGVILLTGHFTPMELCAHRLSLERPFDAMYRPASNVVVDRLTKRARDRRRNTRIFARDDIRAMLRSLRDNRAVWYGPDQDYGRDLSVFAPFFGVDAATITTTARFARMSRARVVPYFPVRGADGRYVIRVLPPLAGYPTGDAEADARTINALVEAAVRACPEQYLWIHRRFKTRPQGEPRLY